LKESIRKDFEKNELNVILKIKTDYIKKWELRSDYDSIMQVVPNKFLENKDKSKDLKAENGVPKEARKSLLDINELNLNDAFLREMKKIDTYASNMNKILKIYDKLFVQHINL